MLDYDMLLNILGNPITIFGVGWLIGDFVLYKSYRAGLFAHQPRDVEVAGPFTFFLRASLERDLGLSVMAPREDDWSPTWKDRL